jgi:GR25 family glycosyltransferase involved in LPS biosynthesis
MANKIFCINLDRRPDRWLHAQEQFNKHGLMVERFAAIDGNDFIRSYPADNANNGCTLSHYFIIERAKLLGYESVMIFEDDIVLHDQFKELLAECLNDLPADWDMLYFGGSHREKPSPVNEHILRVNKTLTTHGYIVRNTMFDKVIDNFKNLDNPVDCFYAAWQQEFNIYITNPPIAWQKGGYSDICNREMYYDWIKTNDQ